MIDVANTKLIVWRMSSTAWLLSAITVALLALLFYKGFDYIFYMWFNKEEYSHAVMIPFICLFLIWQKKDHLERIPFEGSWLGVVVFLVGFAMYLLGQLSSLAMIMNYAMLVVLGGLLLAWMGWGAFKHIVVPYLILVFMIPLPGFLYEGFSGQMQLLSSQIGVWVIRLFDISVNLEGNVIDLGTMKLQVVEACSGLRYLFPLVTLGFIAAYFFKVSLWKRLFVFLSSVPITILMNSFRIGLIGVTVEYWGQDMAEVILHDFEGWVVFMGCTFTLILEMWLLTRFGRDRRPLQEVFGLQFPDPTPADATKRYRAIPRQSGVAVGMLAIATVAAVSVGDRPEIQPARSEFAAFPKVLADWRGDFSPIEEDIAEALRFDDYLMASYAKGPGQVVNLFASYYATQRADKVPHSPRACLPGGGWRITEISPVTLSGMRTKDGILTVNKVIIRHGDQVQVVYYWFQQRGRSIASEYQTKWYLFWDSLTRSRTDGALVRLVTPLVPGEDINSGEERLSDFARQLTGILNSYVPD